jgi:hypothetical protein
MNKVKILPSPIPFTQWLDWTPELERLAIRWPYPNEMLASIKTAFRQACEKPGWNPETVQIGGFLVAIDYCADARGRLHSYNVAVIKDHPFLQTLNAIPHVPRVVKAPYRREVAMRYLRTKDAFGFLADMRVAQEAWDAFHDRRAP